MHSTFTLRSSGAMGTMQQGQLRIRRRVACAPVCAKKGKQQGNVKVNKRGKVSSRPGPGWQPAPETMEQQQEQPQLQQQPSAATAAVNSPPATQQQQSPSPPALQQQEQQQQQQSRQPQPQSPQPQQQRGAQLTETPQVVVDRMFKRVITFAGLPVITGILLFPLFWYLRVVQKIEYPIWVVYVTQAMMFGGGLLGISYGILSTSWDPRREGSALGWTELQANLPVLLNRNKDQAQP